MGIRTTKLSKSLPCLWHPSAPWTHLCNAAQGPTSPAPGPQCPALTLTLDAYRGQCPSRQVVVIVNILLLSGTMLSTFYI